VCNSKIPEGSSASSSDQASENVHDFPTGETVYSLPEQIQPLVTCNDVHLIGTHCIIQYDNKPYPGKIVDINETDVTVECMHCIGTKYDSNRFFSPDKIKDICMYSYDDMLRLFYLTNSDNKRIRVCKNMFCKTICLTNGSLGRALERETKDASAVQPSGFKERRGKKQPKNKTAKQDIDLKPQIEMEKEEEVQKKKEEAEPKKTEQRSKKKDELMAKKKRRNRRRWS